MKRSLIEFITLILFALLLTAIVLITLLILPNSNTELPNNNAYAKYHECKTDTGTMFSPCYIDLNKSVNPLRK